MSHPDPTAIEAAVGTLLGLTGAVLAFRKWARPRWAALVADLIKARDSINGRDAIQDSITGEERVPALPGIGVRMDLTEKEQARARAEQERTRKQLGVLVGQMSNLTDTVRQLAEAQLAQHHLEQRVDDHEQRIVKLENSQVERIIARAESAAAYSAMEAALKADSNEVDLPDDDVIDVEPDE